jgi:hypothetical protein
MAATMKWLLVVLGALSVDLGSRAPGVWRRHTRSAGRPSCPSAAAPILRLPRPLYCEYPGVGHNCWDRAYATPDLYESLLEQKLK